MQTTTVKLQSPFDQSTFEQMEQKGFVLHQIFPTEEGWAGLFKRDQYPDWDTLYKALMVTDIYQFAYTQAKENVTVAAGLAVVIDALQYGMLGSSSTEVAIAAFQSSINEIFAALEANNTPYTNSHKIQLQTLLLAFGFTTIVLP